MKSDRNLKLCSRCGESKLLNEFHKKSDSPRGVQSMCKECRKESDTERYKDPSHRKERQERQQTRKYKEQREEYRFRPEKIEARRKRERSEKHLSGVRKRHHERERDDIQYVLKRALRRRLYNAVINNSKIGSAVDLLGCSVADFKVHIEKHFSYDMSWGNYGKWHLDHKLPLSSFDLTQESQIKTACHYTNIQPLWATDNIKKGSRV